MQLALDNMVKCTELEDTYQDAASNVLVAICKHSWQAVAQHLETELLTGIFPHRSLFYVMGVLSSHGRSCPQHRRGSQGEILGPQSTRTFLFTYYGLILQAADDSTTVRTHLQALLETSHQWPEQREGIALTVGLAAAHHLDDVWAVLDQFGRSRPVKWTLQSPISKVCSLLSLSQTHVPMPTEGTFTEGVVPWWSLGTSVHYSLSLSHWGSITCHIDLQWKWASSTILLAYGQMAARAKAHILPWVDNILSRMIFYFRYSSWDENLKQSFLLAVMMLVKAISRREGAHSYEFSQTSQLLECLIVLMEKESPGVLCTTNRQQAIHIASKLCELRPPIDKDRKSRLLSTCFRSVFALPLMDTLERHTCLFLEPPNIQVKSYSACSAQGLQGQGIGLHLLLTTAGETACMKGPWPPHSQGWGPKQFLIVLGLHFST
uniref:Maestro heat like repeat family member 5 (gene/pseudogene) n=1 Tax=Cavia porcellus TaxID=10141 RepID=A0A286XVI9_CAVPO